MIERMVKTALEATEIRRISFSDLYHGARHITVDAAVRGATYCIAFLPDTKY